MFVLTLLPLLLQIETTVKVAKEKLLSQIELYHNQGGGKDSPEADHRHQKTTLRSNIKLDPVSRGEDKGQPVTTEAPPKQEL